MNQLLNPSSRSLEGRHRSPLAALPGKAIKLSFSASHWDLIHWHQCTGRPSFWPQYSPISSEQHPDQLCKWGRPGGQLLEGVKGPREAGTWEENLSGLAWPLCPLLSIPLVTPGLPLPLPLIVQAM